jgi:NAD(P)-dependent dehydrogenase (short-subunit alcohol dehydrogenase family)
MSARRKADGDDADRMVRGTLAERNTGRPVGLITGGARRIGAAIAAELAPRFDVALHYYRSRDEAETLAVRLRDHGGRVELFGADLADPAAAAALVAAVTDRVCPIDLAVNNASSFTHDDPATFDAAAMQVSLATNLVSPMVIARELARLGSPRAVLVNILDSKVFAPNPDFFSYSLAKFALKASIDMLAMRFRGRMRVAGIAPSVTLRSGDQSQENFERGWRHTLTGAGPTPADIARAVAFIWDTPSLNGTTIVLDGGQHLMSLQRDVAFLDETQ